MTIKWLCEVACSTHGWSISSAANHSARYTWMSVASITTLLCALIMVMMIMMHSRLGAPLTYGWTFSDAYRSLRCIWTVFHCLYHQVALSKTVPAGWSPCPVGPPRIREEYLQRKESSTFFWNYFNFFRWGMTWIVRSLWQIKYFGCNIREKCLS